MSLQTGSRLGPYEIVAPIGAGGMGEVYRARDTRLDRSVAIKIVTDESLKERFDREAKTISSLNHPNICALYDVGDSYIAMELLEGETLREKLELNGSAVRLPIRKAIDYSVQIANGLAAAHEKGIVHRDLKPENVFITNDGRVKILDFGLARSSVGVAALGHPSSATQQKLTSPGTIVGTAGYMSPEQVRGQHVDHRSDIFSFGAMLYEMLSGRRAFKGDSSVETMNAILKEDPPELSVGEIGVPPAIDLIVRHCLEKNREERFQSARDLAFDLERISSASGSAPAIALKTRMRWVAPAIIAVLLVSVAILAWRIRSGAGGHGVLAERKFTLLTNQAGVEDFPSLAPEGKTFVYVSNASGKSDIYLKRVDGRNAINLTKDSNVDNTQPAFSPDGSQIAFRSEREGGGIFLMGATGESVRRLTDFGFNPAWSPDGSEIAIDTESIELQTNVRMTTSSIYVVHVRTGATRRIVAPPQDGVQPSWSPHGDRIAFWAIIGGGGQRDLFTVDPRAANPQQTVVQVTNDPPLDWNPVWSPDGKYLYFGSNRDGTLNLWRVPMDERSGKPIGPLEPLSLPTRFAAHFAFARNTGELAYASVDVSEALWRVPFDPVSMQVTGTATRIFGGAMIIHQFQGDPVSPDGRWVAFSNIGTQEDLFVARVDGSEIRQLTNDPEKDRGPSWSRDGKLLYFYSHRGKRYEIWSIRLDGSGLRQVSTTNGNSIWFPRIMPDGRALYVFNNSGTYLLPLNPDGTTTRIEPLPPMPDANKHFLSTTLSPEGRRFAGATSQPEEWGNPGGIWIYSLDSKRYEQLTNRGYFPQWLPDGKRLLFLDGAGLAVIDIATKQIRPIPIPRPIRGFAIAPDGRALYLDERTQEADIWMVTTK